MIASVVPRTRHPLALRLQCRKEWVEGQGTLSEIARKHNVPPQSLVAWYRRESWTAARNRWHEKQLSDNEAPAKPPAHAPNTGNSTDDPRARKLQRLELQLEALDNLIDNAKSADDWHKLSTAKHRLLENYYILAGIPKPGSRRPGRERGQPAAGCGGKFRRWCAMRPRYRRMCCGRCASGCYRQRRSREFVLNAAILISVNKVPCKPVRSFRLREARPSGRKDVERLSGLPRRPVCSGSREEPRPFDPECVGCVLLD